MPIILPFSEESLRRRLAASGAAVLTAEAAQRQDIRPARIGILNLMPAPAMEATEAQWLRYISHTVLQVEPVLIKFDHDFRERSGASRESILSRYMPFALAAADGLDGLVITGDNLELAEPTDYNRPQELPLAAIRYGSQLAEIIDWARQHIYSTIYSCLASHFALHHIYGLRREIGPRKTFGVYEHRVLTATAGHFTAGLDDTFTAPHSRWGRVEPDAVAGAGVRLLATNDEAGWLLAEAANRAGGRDLFIQGHPEYDRGDLDREYRRNLAHGYDAPPQHYYLGDNPARQPMLTWANDARALHSNWIGAIYTHFSQDQG